jgi:perosamine synthetase
MADDYNIQISVPTVGDEEWCAIKSSIDSGWLTQGPKVKEFENLFAEKHQVRNALATTSCTTALHLMLLAAGIGPGDEVIVPSFTWISTANAVEYCGAKPVLCDVDVETYNISLESIIKKITPNTKAILVVHLFGLCVDVELIKSQIKSNILILEDCACAAGASIRGIPAGKLGLAGAFSFHPRKSITTGEGGMITTDDDNFSSLASKLRNHGAQISEESRHSGAKPYLLPDFDVLGYNYRMTDIQGAIGVVQISKLNRFIMEREQLAKLYVELLSEVPWIKSPVIPIDRQHAWQSFVTMIDPKSSPRNRDLVMEYLHQNGVASRPGTHAIHMLSYYKKKYSLSQSDFPGATSCALNSLALPLHNKMTSSDVKYVVKLLQEIK